MNSKERLDRFMAGESVDRRPNLTIVGSMVTQYTGITVEEYCKNYKAMADAAIRCARESKLDFVQIASDLQREAEGYGTKLTYYADRLPSVAQYALSNILDVEKLVPKKCREIPRLFDLVNATKYVLDTVPEIYPMTIVDGPATIAGNIRGVEDLMIDFFDEPDACEALLDLATDTTLDFLEELAAVGARYVYMPDPIASLFSPNFYQKFILPRHKVIFSKMRELGMTSRLHMCGNTSALLPYTCRCGAQIVDIDHAVNYASALQIVGEHCILNGNIDPVGDVYSATADHVFQAVCELGRSLGTSRCLLMPGCELPTNTPQENLNAIARALEALDGTL